jgi:hypothetical protein
MGMTSFYMGSLRYDPTGRKRKKHAANRVKKKPIEFKSMKSKQSTLDKLRAQQAKQYKSLMEEYMANGNYHEIAGDCTKKETMKYTGTLVKGIATMHKSNAVPVISQQEAEDISKMRRN